MGSKPKIKKITEKVVDPPYFFIDYAQVENVDQTLSGSNNQQEP